MYRDELEDDYIFSLYKNGRGKHIVEVDKRLNNIHFFFLINYLKYPEYIDYKPEIKGFTIATSDEYFSGDELHTVIKVFMPVIERTLDMVHVTTQSNQTYEINFGGKVKEIATKNDFEALDFSAHINNKKEILKLPEKLTEDEKLGLNYSSFSQRFTIISMSYIIVLLASIYFIDSEEHNNYFIYLMIAPFAWLFFEHDYLFNIKAYLKLLLFAFILSGIGVFIVYFKLLKSPEIALAILSAPLIFVMLQKILSYIYITIFKKRPDIDERSFVELVFYQLPLYLLPVILSILVIQFIDIA